ncbi:MAG: hypothetical protein ABJN40_13345 [Sneathiella sp.]
MAALNNFQLKKIREGATGDGLSKYLKKPGKKKKGNPLVDLMSKKPRKKMEFPEYDLQCAVARFLAIALPPEAVWFHVPNGEKRSKLVSARLKEMGLKPGVPDILIYHRHQIYFIELKVGSKGASSYQCDMIEALEKNGAIGAICRSVEEVEDFLAAQGIQLRATVKGMRS